MELLKQCSAELGLSRPAAHDSSEVTVERVRCRTAARQQPLAVLAVDIYLGRLQMRATMHSSRFKIVRRLVHQLNGSPRPGSGASGFAVRIDWPAVVGRSVSHDFVRFATTLPKAQRCAASVQRFWRRGPLRPLAVTVAPMTWSEFLSHRQPCPALDCPTAAPLYGMSGGGQACVQQG
ncbi:hypothetical protein ACFPIJ_57955 [Dactylosporangium cerinum]|uniref:Uncharacterized protein n=1 Tax=Dactylosporangium cerinum TaxID=1434730 RepID=A0ABV9WG74_9ACTN